MQERLQKLLAQAGICSRRAAEELIAAGRVTVNGRPAQLGGKADAARDHICVDGKPIARAEAKLYLMLYKPRGFVTTLHDEKGRRDVSQLVADCGARVYPVGRLDYDSEGLLLMTNDGDLAFQLTHPRHEVPKRYQVSVRGDLAHLPELSRPMKIDGYEIKPAEVAVMRQNEGQASLRIIIHEGRNRQIRKMCAQCGFSVRRLKREAVGELALDSALPAGKWRALTADEIAYLKSL
ncbi:MAG: pseudouridine synthase [Intestinibacillus sp.]